MTKRGVRVALATGAAALAGSWGLAPAQAPAAAEAVAFVDVDVVPMDVEHVVSGQTVIVAGERIVEIGPASTVEIPDGALVVDGAGRYLMPGLAEMHAHIPGPQAEATFGEGYTQRVLFLYLANGITTIRGMLGHASHLELRERAERGEILSPRIYTSGPSLNGNSVRSVETARRMVREQAAAGYDFLKLHPGLTLEHYDAVVEQALESGIAWAGHVSVHVGLKHTLETRQSTVDHLDGYVEALLRDDAPLSSTESEFFGSNLVQWIDPSRIPAWARATAEAGVWNVPTMSLFPDFFADPATLAEREDLRYMPPSMVDRWRGVLRNVRSQPGFDPEGARRFLELRRTILRALRDAGAGLLLGSDAPQVFNVPGFSIHEELAELVAAGLTPYQALRTGSVNVAEFYDALDRRGTVEEGRVADLVLVRGNPLEDVGNIRDPAGVMVRGRWLPAAGIEERLEEIAAGYGN